MNGLAKIWKPDGLQNGSQPNPCSKVSESMYNIRTTKHFEKSLKRCQKRGLPMKALFDAIELLRQTGKLPDEKYRPHKLVGKRKGQWECHINGRNSNWLLVWEQNDTDLILIMLDTGSHSDIF